MLTLVGSDQQRQFGQDKRDSLTPQCRQCEVRSLCHGGCPKDRFAVSRDGDQGQNYLCEGLELFFTHTRPAMRTMVGLLREGRAPSDVMALVAEEDAKQGPSSALPVRERPEVPHLPWQPCASFGIQRDRPRFTPTPRRCGRRGLCPLRKVADRRVRRSTARCRGRERTLGAIFQRVVKDGDDESVSQSIVFARSRSSSDAENA